MNLNDAFRELREADAGEAPPSVEWALRGELRGRRVRRRAGVGVVSLAAAAAGIAMFWPDPEPTPLPAGPTMAFAIPPTVRPVSRPPVRRPKPPAAKPVTDDDVLVLPGASAPLESGLFLRVDLPLMSGDRVQAEVLVGQDGRARTIRFLR